MHGGTGWITANFNRLLGYIQHIVLIAQATVHIVRVAGRRLIFN